MSSHFDRLPIAIDAQHLAPNVTREMIVNRAHILASVDKQLREGTCPGGEFTGWLEPAAIVSADELGSLKSTARRLREETDVLVLIGIGGSYLGARAVIEALADDPDRVVYAGHNISANCTKRLKSQLAGRKVAINVISKSGTTTEPAIAFRIMKDLVGDDVARGRIVATTDANKGALLELAQKHGYETFIVPDNVGGRFSVLSAVGLLPIAYAGIDIDELISGAQSCADACGSPDPYRNPAYFYAAARNVLYHQGFAVELLASFEPTLHFLAEWWKQLYGECEGKENMALYPGSVDFTTDLHSLGQYIQQGRRILTETFLIIDDGEPSVIVPEDAADADGLNYLAGRELSYINCKAHQATAQAHREGGVPNMTILVEHFNARSLGALIYFFEIACAVSGLMLGINPFNQPGVEAYKEHMFELLGKPGYTKPGQFECNQDYVSF